MCGITCTHMRGLQSVRWRGVGAGYPPAAGRRLRLIRAAAGGYPAFPHRQAGGLSSGQRGVHRRIGRPRQSRPPRAGSAGWRCVGLRQRETPAAGQLRCASRSRTSNALRARLRLASSGGATIPKGLAVGDESGRDRGAARLEEQRRSLGPLGHLSGTCNKHLGNAAV